MFQKRQRVTRSADRDQIAHAAAWGGRPPIQRTTILSWRSAPNPAGTVIGLLDVELPSGLQLLGCKLMVSSLGKLWVAPLSSIRRDTDDQPILGENGRASWAPLIGFRDNATRERFRSEVLDALRREYPEAVRDAGGAAR
jgi:hypothetical protein